ncbi:MAG: hypothetical protein K8L97_14135 [Anaerolineae bacterium]|nr:hypothetical protein [Anaerolineae bacterium]
MLNIFNRERVKPITIALILIGLAALLFGGYRFVDAALQIQNNLAFQLEQSGGEVSPQSDAEAQMLVSTGLEYRELLRRRNESLMVLGGGIVLLAVGWLGADVLNGRRKDKGELAGRESRANT